MSLGVAGENIALVRMDVPAAAGTAGRVEIEVTREAGSYAVQLRDISPAGVKGAELPEVSVTKSPACIRSANSAAYDSSLPCEKLSDGSLSFSTAEDSPHTAHLLCIRSAGKCTVYPLRLARQDFTLRTPLETAEERKLDLELPLPDKPEEKDCVLRLRPEVPVPFGSAPLLVEVYRSAGNYTIITSDPSPQGDAAYSIGRVECQTDPEGDTAVYCTPIQTDARNLGLYRTLVFGFCHMDTPFTATIILADEWGNTIGSIALPFIMKVEDQRCERAVYLSKPDLTKDSPAPEPAAVQP